MKTIYIAAMALAFATPAAAQPQETPAAPTTPARDDAGHAQHRDHDRPGADHGRHAGCCSDANGDGKMDCCEGDKVAQRPCCEKPAASSPTQPQ